MNHGVGMKKILKSLTVVSILLMSGSVCKSQDLSPEAAAIIADAEKADLEGAAAGASAHADAAVATSAGALKCSSAMEALSAAIVSCNGAGKLAKICLPNNPGLATAAGAVGLLLNGVSMMKSVSDACKKMNEGLDIAKDALTIYNTACSAASWNCNSSCSNIPKLAASAKSGCDADAALFKQGAAAARAMEPIAEAAAQIYDKNAATALSVGAKAVKAGAAMSSQIKLCSADYKLNMYAAAAGLMGMLTSSKDMSQCQKAVQVNCVANPTDKSCPQTVDCTNSANAQNTQCICKANPTAPGCGGSGVAGGNVPGGTKATSATDGKNNMNYGSYSGGLGENDSAISPTGGSGSGGSLSGGGAAGGGGGGGVGGAGAKEAKAADKKAGLNANILGGYEGGGGGGGGGSRGSGSSSGDSALKAYLPGGAKDPSRNLASQTFGNGEVTASGSKSNWEKVNERYRDAKTSLMGN